jgi:hypothetical protein
MNKRTKKLEFSRRPTTEPTVNRPLQVLVNIYDMNVTKPVHHYSVQFIPDIDTRESRNQRKMYINKLLRPLKVKFGMVGICLFHLVVIEFDNTALYVIGSELKKLSFAADSVIPHQISFALLEILKPGSPNYRTQWISVAVGDVLKRFQNYFQMGRKFLNPSNKEVINKQLEMYRGSQFIPISVPDGSYYMMISRTRQFMRTESVLDVFEFAFSVNF